MDVYRRCAVLIIFTAVPSLILVTSPRACVRSHTQSPFPGISSFHPRLLAAGMSSVLVASMNAQLVTHAVDLTKGSGGAVQCLR